MGLLILFLFLFIKEIQSFDCPNGFQPIPNQNDCVLVVEEAKFYNDVIHYCYSRGAIPGKIRNLWENAYILSTTEDLNGVSPFIGVERKENGTWTYSDGFPLAYQNWDFNEPKANTSTICAVMDAESGKWISVECFVARPFICSIGGSDPTTTQPIPSTSLPTTYPPSNCPSDWVYNQQTDHCYFLQNITIYTRDRWERYEWTEAESLCQLKGNGSHLTSIHSKEEDDFVYDLVYSNFNSLSQYACGYQFAWIGYSGNGTIGTGNWSDGTLVDYIGWSRDKPLTNYIFYWMIGNDPSCDIHRWNWNYSITPFARFVCKMSPKRKNRSKVQPNI